MTTRSSTHTGLPLTSSRIEKIFPKLTPAQIDRIAAHGHIRSVQSGEMLIKQGDTNVPFFVVITGEVEIVRPFDAYETLVTVHGSGQFTGEVNMLSGRRSLFQARATRPSKVIELDHQQMLTLVQTDAELSNILMRAFILRRVELIAAGVGDIILIGSTYSAGTLLNSDMETRASTSTMEKRQSTRALQHRIQPKRDIPYTASGTGYCKRDISYLRNQAKTNIKRYIDERLPEEYEKCLVGLNAITKEAWTTLNTEDKREKIQALS